MDKLNLAVIQPTDDPNDPNPGAMVYVSGIIGEAMYYQVWKQDVLDALGIKVEKKQGD